jgi:hypothetical protein
MHRIAVRSSFELSVTRLHLVIAGVTQQEAMLFGNPKLYAAARDAKLGITRLPPTLERLRVWINDHYAVTVLHIVYDQIDIGPLGRRPSLNLIVDTAADYAALHRDQFTPKRNVQITIARRFAKYARENTAEYNTQNVHIVFDDFSDEAMGQAARRFRAIHADEVVRSFRDSNVWAITGMDKHSVVFYLDHDDVAANNECGISQSITERCFELTRRYDEFGYFTLSNFSLSFDSRQRFDTEFEGNWFHYFR